jgi:hypothetical protein
VLGTLDLSNASRVNGTLALTGATLQGSGPVSVNGALALNAATLAGGGVVVNGTTGVNVGASQLSASALVTSGLDLSSGSLTVGAGSTLGLVGDAPKSVSNGVLTNAGTLTIAGSAPILLNGGGTLANAGTVDIQSDADIQTSVGTGTLTNTGLLRKSAGAGTTTLAPTALISSGVFNVQTGTVEFAAAATRSMTARSS